MRFVVEVTQMVGNSHTIENVTDLDQNLRVHDDRLEVVCGPMLTTVTDWAEFRVYREEG